MRKYTAIPALVAVSAIALAGCSGSETPSSDSSPSGKVTWWSPNWDEDVATELIAEFEAENPDIEVDMVVTTWDTMANKIRTALQSGTGPDVITELTSRVPSYASRGELADLSEWYGGEALPIDDFNESALEAVTVKDTVYGVPFRWDAGAMIYNADLFEQAGVEAPPANIAELQKVSEQLKAAGITAYGWQLGNNENAAVRWLDHYYSRGGEFTVKDGAVKIDPQASAAALEDVARGFSEGYVSQSSFEVDNTGLRELFANEQIAMYFGGAFDIAPLQEKGLNLGTAEWPGPDGPGTVSADGFSFIVPAKAKNPAAAKELVEFLASPENEARLTQTFPARISSGEDEKFADPLLNPFLDQLNEHGRPRPTFEGWTSMTDTIYSATQKVALGKQTPQDGAAEIQVQADNVLRG